MVELLVVVLILSILVGLVVAVSKYVNDEAAKKSTKATQAIVTSVINNYYSSQGSYPVATTTSELVAKLLDMNLVPDCAKAMQSIPKAAMTGGTLIDGWGREMTYKSTGGFGGVPVLISAGPDGKMDTDEDNIRSDK